MPSSQTVTDLPQGSLSEFHPLITPGRDTGNGFYLSARRYPSGDVEAIAMQLNSDDSLKRGGGHKRKNSNKGQMSEEVLTKSLIRAKTMVRRKCLSMCADRMLTLTFRENVTDLKEAWGCFHYFIKLMRKSFDDFPYVVVPELQKRGAVHFHLAIKGYYPVTLVRKHWLRAIGKREGNIDITPPRDDKGKKANSPKKIANYIAKYITKTDIVAFNKRRYASGGKIEIPAPICGWLALGVPVVVVLTQALNEMTEKPVAEIWEAENYFSLVKIST